MSSRRDGPSRRTSAGAVEPVVELDALGQAAQRLLARFPLDLGLVDLGHLVAGMGEPVGERPVVREDERAGRVDVEAADRDDPERVPHEADHGRPALGVARRRDDPRRLVQEQVGERLGRELGPVQLDPVAGLDERRQAGDLSIDPHPAGADQLLGASPGGDPCTREVGVQAHPAIIRAG